MKFKAKGIAFCVPLELRNEFLVVYFQANNKPVANKNT